MTWRRVQVVLLSALGMAVAKITEVTFSSTDRVREVIHNFHADGFDSLCGATTTATPSECGWVLAVTSWSRIAAEPRLAGGRSVRPTIHG